MERLFQKGVSDWKVIVGGSTAWFTVVQKETVSYMCDGSIEITIETADTVPIAQAVKVLREPVPKIEIRRKRYMFNQSGEKMYLYERYWTDKINMMFSAEGPYPGECSLHFIVAAEDGAVETKTEAFS